MAAAVGSSLPAGTFRVRQVFLPRFSGNSQRQHLEPSQGRAQLVRSTATAEQFQKFLHRKNGAVAEHWYELLAPL